MIGKRNRGYRDVSFVLQSLDNTSTIGQVDHDLLDLWTRRKHIEYPSDRDKAVAYLLESVVDLQVYGQLTELGSETDPITLHRDDQAFVARFSVDTRDRDNRRANILFVGRLPRETSRSTSDHGERALKNFLGNHQIEYTKLVRHRYQLVCNELVRSTSGNPLSWLSRQRNQEEDVPTVRLGRNSIDAVTPADARTRQSGTVRLGADRERAETAPAAPAGEVAAETSEDRVAVGDQTTREAGRGREDRGAAREPRTAAGVQRSGALRAGLGDISPRRQSAPRAAALSDSPT